MNLLIYGGYHNDYIYTQHLAKGISRNKVFNTFPTFYEEDSNRLLRKKNHYFPPTRKIKNYLEQIIIKNKITYILNYNTNHFSSDLICSLKKSYSIKVCAYFNDSPFSSHLSKKIYYQNQKKTLSNYDFIFVYRKDDKDRIIRKYNFKNKFIKVLPPSCPEKKYLNYIKVSKNFLFDFAFIGHFESDGRINLIRELISMGYNCLVIGHKWPEKRINIFKTKSKILNKRLNYIEYLSYLSSAYVNLGFVSKINNDSYTRRYFECPFSNSLFLAYYSEIYKNYSNNMPNIYFSNNKIPRINECIKALQFSMLAKHYPNSEQKEMFFKNNSIYKRASIISDLLLN